MARPAVSVVMATFNRAHLLERSLHAYATQYFPLSAMELVVVDDHSTDDTQKMLRKWSAEKCIPVQIVMPCPKDAEWRDCGAVINHGIRVSRGNYVIMTHPEVIPGKKSIGAFVDTLRTTEYRYDYGAYACSKVYYLTQQNQKDLALIDWENRGTNWVEHLPNFFEEDGQSDESNDYSHASTRRVATDGFRIQQWESWVFGGMTRGSMYRLGGMLETKQWGSVDVAFMNRRKLLGIPTITSTDLLSSVVHQNHDGPGNVPTPRVEQAWKEELRGITFSKEQMQYPAVDNL